MKVKNRVLNAEKAILSTSERHFPKGEYNIPIPSELRQKVIVAQQLFAPKWRHRTLPKLLTLTPDMV